ncbi:histidine kinase [Bacteroides faecium]|uniref:Histidine kinase n=1 Tax=Bacteroides faecium TaxID=2715212 RepID=A0A6H0KSN2_9BACE|nr:histidine kinase [Bacteroides faecium]
MPVRIPLYRLLKQIGIFLLVTFLVFRGTFVEDNSVGLNPVTGVNLVLSLILWGIINLHTYRVIPEYLFQRRYKAYICFTISLVLCMLLLLFIGAYIMGQYYPMPDNIKTINSRFFFFLLLNALALILYFFAFSFTIFLRRWVSYHQRLDELENNGLQTELNHLKEQLQPDFLSKMLNKARTLSLEDTDRASALIFKLSRLLRYQLYESGHKKVLLGDDMRFMTDYLELEKICNPTFKSEIRMESKVAYMQIPPLLFMPIIEYAIQESIEEEKYITIELKAEKEMLLFTCTYRLKESVPRKSLPAFEKLRHRLKLLYPKGDYLLENRCDNQSQCVTDLKIKL